MQDTRPPKSWVTVASADHAARGRAEGFIQVNHGKSAPLHRMHPGDRVMIYAPVRVYGGKDRLQAFVAHGRIADRPVYQGDMGGGFTPFRRDMLWDDCVEAPIAPLLPRLGFTAGRTNWGQPFRWGVFEIAKADAELIAQAMRVGHYGQPD